MVHIFVGDDHVVLASHVVRDVVVHNESEESVKQGKVHLLIDFLVLGLEQDHAFAVAGVPYVLEVIDALAPFVD